MTDLAAVLRDYRRLDALQPSDIPEPATALVYEDIGPERTRRVDISGPPLWRALRLLAGCRRSQALLLNQVDRAASLACVLNAFLPGRLKRKLVLYDVFIDTPRPWKRRLIRWMVRGATVNVLFSRRQVQGYARLFGLPESRFIFVPYQSSHSKRPPRNDPPGDYVFSGGNSARDYRTLCEAVRGTGIRVKVTTTDPTLFDGVVIPPEVEIEPVVEPQFTQRMAASRFVVMCLTPGRVRGYGEQTILNSWWHGRAVVAADDVSAPDYLVNGENGYCLAPGDVPALREAMLTLWRDGELAVRMGECGRAAVEANYTHRHFVHRLHLLTLLLAAQG